MNCTDACLNTLPCTDHYLTFNAYNNSLDSITIARSQVFTLPVSVAPTEPQLEVVNSTDPQTTLTMHTQRGAARGLHMHSPFISLIFMTIYIVLLYPDDRRPCVAMTPWLTPHFN